MRCRTSQSLSVSLLRFLLGRAPSSHIDRQAHAKTSVVWPLCACGLAHAVVDWLVDGGKHITDKGFARSVRRFKHGLTFRPDWTLEEPRQGHRGPPPARFKPRIHIDTRHSAQRSSTSPPFPIVQLQHHIDGVVRQKGAMFMSCNSFGLLAMSFSDLGPEFRYKVKNENTKVRVRVGVRSMPSPCFHKES